jgi:hypothetical protein
MYFPKFVLDESPVKAVHVHVQWPNAGRDAINVHKYFAVAGGDEKAAAYMAQQSGYKVIAHEVVMAPGWKVEA